MKWTPDISSYTSGSFDLYINEFGSVSVDWNDRMMLGLPLFCNGLSKPPLKLRHERVITPHILWCPCYTYKSGICTGPEVHTRHTNQKKVIQSQQGQYCMDVSKSYRLQILCHNENTVGGHEVKRCEFNWNVRSRINIGDIRQYIRLILYVWNMKCYFSAK